MTVALPQRSRSGGLGGIVARMRSRPTAPAGLAAEEIVAALYRAMLGREPDAPGLAGKVEAIGSGTSLDRVVDEMVRSPEFRARMLRELVPSPALPDLTQVMPEHYRAATATSPVLYLARRDDDIALMESLIAHHRYYDRFDVWSPVIDLDKEIIAAIVRGLGAGSCFELGCFTGPVLSLLADAGMAVAGTELSHHAFAFAYQNVREAMMFGDLLEVEIDRRFDVVLCMDVLEHLSPLKLDRHIAKIASLATDDGWVVVNSPMWGRDEVFGTAAEPCFDSWREIGDSDFWREWPCDARGWPEHGHLVWASPNWWTARFAAHGLRRDTAVERVLHYRLGAFFDQAPGRRSLFVLRHPNNQQPAPDVAAAVDASLCALPGVAA